MSTTFTLSLDQLLERFPLTAERFRFSKNWKPNKEEDVAVDLVAFLGKRDFVIQSTMIFEEDAPVTDDPIGYELDVKIKSHPVDVGEHWFTDLDEARLHALNFVLEIFEEEQKGLD
ncbi:MAG TPA: hypothetical protein PK149_11195 [Flavobacteriales bacterium]|nr:hypothetical protein [Flavobacteriales bacterium]